MENLLYEYMSKRFSSEHVHNELHPGLGPVITISRQGGCGASKLAHDICQLMNSSARQSSKSSPWHFINHEILEHSAEKLELDPKKLHQVITDKERGIMDQIVEALSSHSHKSDQKIMKTVQDVIRQFAEQGNVVIVGRGGAVVSQHIPRSLHVRLEAPLEWRLEQVIKKLEYSREYAREYINKIDEQRQMYLNKMLIGRHIDSIFDITLNPSRFSDQQLVDIIIHIAALKGI
jgi:cytidylate kinase